MKLQRNRNYSILIESTIEIRFGFFQQQKIPLQHLVKMSQQDKAQQQNHTIMKRWALKSKMRLIWCSSLCFIIYFFYLSLCDFGMQVHFCSQPVFDLFGCSPGIFHYKFNYSMDVLWFFVCAFKCWGDSTLLDASLVTVPFFYAISSKNHRKIIQTIWTRISGGFEKWQWHASAINSNRIYNRKQ